MSTQVVGAGVSEQAPRLEEALRDAMRKADQLVFDREVSDRESKPASVCGEDARCLASLGRRAGARWVLAFSLGRLAGTWVLGASLIDVERGERLIAASRELSSKQPDWSIVGQGLFKELWDAVPVVEAPVASAPTVPPQLSPAIVAAPTQVLAVEPVRSFRGAAVATTVATGALVVGTLVVGLLAKSNFDALPAAKAEARPGLDAQQRTLNVVGDVGLGLSIAAAGVATTLWVLDATQESAP